jgi:hypothetical protein
VPSDIIEAPHLRTETCNICHFWVAHTYYDMDVAGRHNLDEQKIMADVLEHRLHGVLSVAHYHSREEKCNDRCVK